MKKLTAYWHRLTLKRKWALTSASVLFISFALVCVILYIAINSWLLNEEKTSVTRSMDDLTAFFETRGSNLTINEMQHNTGLMNSIVDKDQTVRILNTDGIEILRLNNTSEEIPDLPQNIPLKGYTIQQVKVDGADSFVAIGHLRLGNFDGYLQLTHPLTSLASLMKYILTSMLLMGLIALIASWFISSALATLLLQPLKRLSSDMKRVAAHRFEAPIQVTVDSQDEIGDLVKVYKQMMTELESAFLQQQRFISDASHELRTPIQVLEGHLSMIQRWGKDDPEVLNESLMTSIDEVRRMKQLIEELLELARHEAKDISQGAIVAEQTEIVMKEMKTIAPNAEINLHYNEDFHNVRVMISENAYRQILHNILQNAVRYTSSIPSINIYLTFDLNNCTIVIEDNGIGMSPESLEHIFERFYRVDKARSREHGGTGLGLSIVKMLIDKYDGTLEVSSALNEGTTFTIHLPLFLVQESI
ncbi:histidine kinase [Kurthia sp. 3B1D]|uniref:Signal transduction histidine-protein kinase ArlS n=1 Tax=Candidatus Kurthia intestinigallinarum TaxID=1562256 RepID=A0A433RSH1_9BACL|nr:HAMP domain-containing histidine kinase [Kurthia sp. 3B1D]RUS55104.1 histidine kinase [Kurthia sp. 3B1D]